MSALEDALGVLLFHRSTRRVTLTEAGAVFREHAQAVVDAAAAAQDAVDALTAAPRGTLTVAASPAMGPWLVRLAGDFLAANPELDVRFDFREEHVDLIHEGLDLAVRVGHPPDSALIARPIVTTESVVSAAPGYLARHGTPQHPTDLATHQCLAVFRRRWRFSKGDEQHEVAVGGRLRVNDAQALLAAATANLGITLTPDWLVADLHRSGALVPLLSDYQIEPRGTVVNAVFPARRHLPPKVRAFVEFLVDQAPAALSIEQ